MNTSACRSWWGRALLPFVSLLFFAACQADGDPATLRTELGEVRGAPTNEPEPPPPPRLSTMIAESSPDDEIVLADATTGARIDAQPAPGRVVDLSSDASRVYALAATDDGVLLHAWPWSAAGLGQAVELGGLEGDGRLLATPWGYVVFEHAMGPRWRLVGESGPEPSRVCGRPQSLHVVRGAGVWQLEALVWNEAETRFELARATVGPEGLSPCESTQLDVGVEVSSARLAWSGDGHERWLFGLRANQLVVGLIASDAQRPGVLDELPLSSARLEAVVSLGATVEGRQRYAILLGPEAKLAVVELDAAADGRAGRRVAAELALPGRAFERDQYFGRDLLAQAGALLVATNQGLHTVEIVEAPGSLTLVPRAGSEPLAASRRGPMALLGASWEPE